MLRPVAVSRRGSRVWGGEKWKGSVHMVFVCQRLNKEGNEGGSEDVALRGAQGKVACKVSESSWSMCGSGVAIIMQGDAEECGGKCRRCMVLAYRKLSREADAS